MSPSDGQREIRAPGHHVIYGHLPTSHQLAGLDKTGQSHRFGLSFVGPVFVELVPQNRHPDGVVDCWADFHGFGYTLYFRRQLVNDSGLSQVAGVLQSVYQELGTAVQVRFSGSCGNAGQVLHGCYSARRVKGGEFG